MQSAESPPSSTGTEESTKEFSARVPLTEYERFRNRFPQYGATNWFINMSLKQFNDACDRNPDAEQLVGQAIQIMLSERRQ